MESSKLESQLCLAALVLQCWSLAVFGRGPHLALGRGMPPFGKIEMAPDVLQTLDSMEVDS